jgi:hypothetical protein
MPAPAPKTAPPVVGGKRRAAAAASAEHSGASGGGSMDGAGLPGKRDDQERKQRQRRQAAAAGGNAKKRRRASVPLPSGRGGDAAPAVVHPSASEVRVRRTPARAVPHRCAGTVFSLRQAAGRSAVGRPGVRVPHPSPALPPSPRRQIQYWQAVDAEQLIVESDDE